MELELSAEEIQELESSVEEETRELIVKATADRKALLEAAKPLIKYLAENHHPHTKAIVTATEVEVLEAVAINGTEEFLVD